LALVIAVGVVVQIRDNLINTVDQIISSQTSWTEAAYSMNHLERYLFGLETQPPNLLPALNISRNLGSEYLDTFLSSRVCEYFNQSKRYPLMCPPNYNVTNPMTMYTVEEAILVIINNTITSLITTSQDEQSVAAFRNSKDYRLLEYQLRHVMFPVFQEKLDRLQRYFTEVMQDDLKTAYFQMYYPGNAVFIIIAALSLLLKGPKIRQITSDLFVFRFFHPLVLTQNPKVFRRVQFSLIE